MQEKYVVGAVAKDAFLAVSLYEAENERTYVNSNGVEFTLIDGYEEENDNAKDKITKVLLGCDHYFGSASFRGVSEKEIHSVLDCFKVNYVAPEYEHFHPNR